MSRKENWPSFLFEEIEKARKAPFSWAEHNCALWSADVVLAMTGVDYAAEFRAKVKTEKSALRFLKKKSLKAIVSDRLQEIPLKMAQRGDVVLMTSNGLEALGICLGELAAFITKDGLTFYPIDRAVCAWRVD
jgi:hypothetical protein